MMVYYPQNRDNISIITIFILTFGREKLAASITKRRFDHD
jgi:hypothetical protein